jgi:hypothetical protein
MELVTQDIIELTNLNINDCVRAIKKPYENKNKSLMIERMNKRIIKSEVGSNTNRLIDSVLTSLDERDIGLRHYLEKDRLYKKLIKKLNNQQNIVASEEASKAIQSFKTMVYKINNTCIIGQYIIDTQQDNAPKDGLLDIARRIGIADDEINKYKTPVVIALVKLRKDLEKM